MRQPPRNRLIWAVSTAYLLLAAICLKGDDLLVVRLMDNVNSIKLARQAHSDLSLVHAEERETTVRVEALRNRVSALAARRVPTINDLKALLTDCHLRLVQIERVAGSTDDDSRTINYRTVLAGNVGGAVRFVHDLEERFLIDSDQMTLSSLGEDGSQVNVVLTVEIAKE